MSLKVLLADDNITAQRLGSKILTEAGFEVIAVSNGAAAVKKIASDKPELLILDVYMPGYSGLEVCEKVKNDPSTAQVPVILTVTNMEPFNQQDGSRVRADGLMIKPFEATDLLAVVQKYAAKSAKNAAPSYAETIKMQAPEEFKDASYEEWKSDAAEEPEEQKMRVPDEIASAPALGFDDTPPVAAAAPVTSELPSPAAFTVDTPAFGSEAPVAFDSAPATMPWDAAPAPPVESVSGFESHAEIAPPAELEYNAAPPVEVNVAPAAELETTGVPAAEVGFAQDPALVTNPDEMAQFATSVGVEHPEDIPVGIAMPGLTAEETPAEPPAEEYSTTVKLNAYVEPPVEDTSAGDETAAIDALPEPAAEAVETAPSPAIEEPSPVEEEMQRAFAASSYGAAAAPAPAIEPEPTSSYIAAPEQGDLTQKLVAEFAAELDQAHQEREAMAQAEPPVEEQPLTESSMEMAPDVPASQLDEERIAAAVTRALDKYKEGLRAELIATIVRELKG